MAQRCLACLCLAVALAAPLADAFAPASSIALFRRRSLQSATHTPSRSVSLGLRMQVQDEEKPRAKDPEEVTKKYGLEAGIFTALTSKTKDGPDAKELLKKYGSAYLITSISLALVSFSICYVLVDNGVDVGALLAKVGIEATGKAETAGTVAIAYAAHKAASPIRFPPTVALTPLTAKRASIRVDDAAPTPFRNLFWSVSSVFRVNRYPPYYTWWQYLFNKKETEAEDKEPSE